MAQVAITGNTYPCKEQLKKLGATWDSNYKCWMIDSSKAAEANKLVVEFKGTTVGKQLTREEIIEIAVRKRNGTPGVCGSCGTSCKYPYDECWDCKEERQMGY